jgi:hypothetical protein
MSYDSDCATYWCDKCGKEMTLELKASDEDVLVLKCQGNPLVSDVGCGACREFTKVEPHECPHRREERLAKEAEEASNE